MTDVAQTVWRMCTQGSRAAELCEVTTGQARDKFAREFERLPAARRRELRMLIDACRADEYSLVDLQIKADRIDRRVGEALLDVLAFYFATNDSSDEEAKRPDPYAETCPPVPSDAEMWERTLASARAHRIRLRV